MVSLSVDRDICILALERLIKIKCAKRIGLRGFNSSRPYFMQFAMDVSKEEFLEILVEEANKDFDSLELVYPNEVPVFDKYDEYLPDELVRKEFAHSILDIEEMKNALINCNKKIHSVVMIEWIFLIYLSS